MSAPAVVEVHIPDPRTPFEKHAERMEQQINDAMAGTDVEVFEFISETFINLHRLYGPGRE